TDGPVGQVAGPIESPGNGWFLVKIVDRRPRTREPFDQVRDGLRSMLQQGKRRAQLEQSQRDLTAQYHVKIAPDAVEILFRRYNSPKDTIRVGNAPMPVAAPPTPQEARQPLAQYDGLHGAPVPYTLGDAVKDLQNEANPHPNFNVSPMIDQWVRAMVLQKVLAVEVERRHIAEEPAIVRQARRERDNVLLQAAYGTLVADRSQVTENDIRADFERHASQLKRVQNVRLRVALISDSAAARRAAQSSQGGAPFADIVRAGAARVSETAVSYPTNDPIWKVLESSFLRMEPGQSEGPFARGRGTWIVVQLVDKTVLPMAWETVDPGTRQALQGEAAELKREARLNQVTDSLRTVYRPVIYSKRLKSIPWPVPAAPAPGA
ncbi:MAG TPA: peptidylprolyl isomerase, partial [Terriglobales bacterium]|nr:peptidylprolyl isomerase [Terriglobales bacterium]